MNFVTRLAAPAAVAGGQVGATATRVRVVVVDGVVVDVVVVDDAAFFGFEGWLTSTITKTTSPATTTAAAPWRSRRPRWRRRCTWVSFA